MSTRLTDDNEPTSTLEPSAESAVRAFILEDTDSVFAQVFRFGIIGALATVVDSAILHVLVVSLHVMVPLAVAAGFGVGLAISNLLSIKWVFATRSLGSRRKDFAAFTVIGIIGFALTELIVNLGVYQLGRNHVLLAKMIAVVTVFFWNFGARRMLLFRNK